MKKTIPSTVQKRESLLSTIKELTTKLLTSPHRPEKDRLMLELIGQTAENEKNYLKGLEKIPEIIQEHLRIALEKSKPPAEQSGLLTYFRKEGGDFGHELFSFQSRATRSWVII